VNQSRDCSVKILISHPTLFPPYQRRIHYSLFIINITYNLRCYTYAVPGLSKWRSPVATVTMFCKLVPNICRSSEWNLLTVTLQAHRILRWHLDVWNIRALLQNNRNILLLFDISCFRQGVVEVSALLGYSAVHDVYRLLSVRNIISVPSSWAKHSDGNFFLDCLTWYTIVVALHTMKEYGGSRGTAPLIPSLHIRWIRAVKFPPPVWVVLENRKSLAPTGISTPDRPTHSLSLYILRYPGSNDIC